MTTPETTVVPKNATLAGKLVALAGITISCAYLANLGAGVFGEIPDVVPGLGNLDEFFFSGLLILSLHKLGINIIPGMASTRPLTPKNLSGPRDGA